MTASLCMLLSTQVPLFAAGLALSEGKLNGSAVTSKIGSLLSNDLLVFMEGAEIKVQEKDAEPGKVLLRGSLANLKSSGGRLSGLCFFKSGDGLDKVIGKDASVADVVEAVSGEKFACRIENMTPDSLLFILDGSAKEMPFSQIAAIHSARVFAFSAKEGGNGADSGPSSIEFKASTDRGLAARLSREKTAIDAVQSSSTLSENIVGSLIATGALCASLGLILPLAIAIPIRSYREKMRNRRNSQQAELLYRLNAPRPVNRRVNNNNNNN